MKKLLLIVLLFCSIMGFSQSIIPKKAYKIIIINTLSAEENFILVGNTLASNDFTIESKDKEFGMIKTAVKLSGVWYTSHFYIFIIKQGEINITGQWSPANSIGESSSFLITNKAEVPKKLFNKMNNFALQLNPKLKYIVE